MFLPRAMLSFPEFLLSYSLFIRKNFLSKLTSMCSVFGCELMFVRYGSVYHHSREKGGEKNMGGQQDNKQNQDMERMKSQGDRTSGQKGGRASTEGFAQDQKDDANRMEKENTPLGGGE